MAGHRYWLLTNLTTDDSNNYVAGAEVYLRQTAGGTNEVPVASASSASYSSGPDVLYDGNPSTWWASQAVPRSLAFDYGADILPVELFWQNRPDWTPQGARGGDVLYSDTGLSGPWTPYGTFTYPAWTSNGQIQLAPIVLPAPEITVTEQHALAPFVQDPALVVTEQHGYAAFLLDPAIVVTEQHAYAFLVPGSAPPPPTPVARRRQYTLM